MHLTPSDPDVATLYRKIRQGRLDLQPNFQRGEVWGKSKKQRLIDSILRGWHIPPIHVIQVPDSDKQEVLDGQQRLAAIRDFIEGHFPVNGSQDPLEPHIYELDGLYYEDLPGKVSARIDDFTIRLLTISEYKHGEPGELFYRLNQPTNLTSAEQRNAYFGEARQQVKELSEYMTQLGLNRDTVGFSNSRMAYDDVISKFLLTLEMNTLKKKITANTVTARYREEFGFDRRIIREARTVLKYLAMCLSGDSGLGRFKLNKASSISWMIFIFSYMKEFNNTEDLVEYFSWFEVLKEKSKIRESFDYSDIDNPKKAFGKLFSIYQDRASSRVADTSSVVLRDVCLWVIYTSLYPHKVRDNGRLYSLYIQTKRHLSGGSSTFTEGDLEHVASSVGWGDGLW